MLMLFTAVASLLVESGFASALIQKQDHTYTDECTVFWFNLIAGTFAAAALILIAPSIALFYQQPILVPLTKLMALNLWLSAFLTVPRALLTKNLDFKTQMKAGMSGLIVSGGIAIYLAFNGWGVWAIAIQSLAATLVSGLVLWGLNSWRPSWVFSWNSFHRLFTFGGFLLLSGLLDTISTRVYTLIIGKSYGAQDLGYFYRASSTKDLPQGVLAGIFSRVAFPVYSSQAKDKDKLRECLRISLIITMAVNLPVMAGLLMTADELVPLLFGSRWEPSIPILKVLCGVGLFWPLHLANLNVLRALGYSRLIFKIEIIKKSLFIAMIILTSQISVITIAWGMFVVGLVGVLINTWYTKNFLGYGPFEQLTNLMPYFFITLMMMGAVVSSQFIFDSVVESEFMILLFLTKLTVGFTTYIVLTYALNLEVLKHGRSFLNRSELS